MKESILMRALEALRQQGGSLFEQARPLFVWQNLDAALIALALIALLRFKAYHRIRHMVFEISGARLSMCGIVNKAFSYWFIFCCGYLAFQIINGRLL